MGKEIVWTNHALADFNNAFLDFLEESESIEVTTRVFDEIFESTEILKTNAELYKADVLKSNNDLGMVRFYEKHTYRISYQVTEDTVYIIRVRYARKEPLPY